MILRRRHILFMGTWALAVIVSVSCNGRNAPPVPTKEDIRADLPLHIREALEKTFSPKPGERTEAIERLGDMGARAGPAVRFLIRFLGIPKNSKGPEVGDEIWSVSAIRKIGAPAVPELLRHLHSNNVERRKRIASLLGEIGDPRAVAPLIASLGDDDLEVRYAVAAALGRLKDDRAVKPLIKVVGDTEQESTFRSAAVLALGKLDCRLPVEPFLGILHDQNEKAGLRGRAASALGQTGDEAVFEPLVAALKDEHEVVRRYAVQGLGRLGGPRAVEALLTALKDSKDAAHQWFFSCVTLALVETDDQRGVKAVIAVLDDRRECRGLRLWALDALARSENPKVYRCAIEALKDPERQIRAEAVRILATGELPTELTFRETGNVLPALKDGAVVPPMVAVLRDKAMARTIRADAAHALGKTGHRRATEPLIEVLNDPMEHPELRAAAVRALAKAADPLAAPAIERASMDPQETVRSAGKEAWGRFQKAKRNRQQ